MNLGICFAGNMGAITCFSSNRIGFAGGFAAHVSCHTNNTRISNTQRSSNSSNSSGSSGSMRQVSEKEEGWDLLISRSNEGRGGGRKKRGNIPR